MVSDIKLHPNAKDITGMSFSKLTVIGVVGRFKDRKVKWLCLCVCGGKAITSSVKLKSGHTKSCGCLKSIVITKAKTTHGMSSAEEYSIWGGMRNRCLNKNNDAYSKYGGRGIFVCERWSLFENFYEDMGPRPSKKHSVERADNDKGYSPENCYWATYLEQANNQSTNRPLTLKGRTQNLSSWARELGIHATSLSDRMSKLGWSVEKALSTPKTR